MSGVLNRRPAVAERHCRTTDTALHLGCNQPAWPLIEGEHASGFAAADCTCRRDGI